MRSPITFIKHWLFEEPEPDDERRATIMGLRALARALERHPELEMPFNTVVYHNVGKDEPALTRLRELRRLMPGLWTKAPAGENFILEHVLGGKVKYRLEAKREDVCEKRVVGQRTVQRPDYRYPPPMTTVVEDIVEWDCPEILA